MADVENYEEFEEAPLEYDDEEEEEDEEVEQGEFDLGSQDTDEEEEEVRAMLLSYMIILYVKYVLLTLCIVFFLSIGRRRR